MILDVSTPLFLPRLGGVYRELSPCLEALLRVVTGLALVPHGLRTCFGFFPNTGGPIRSLPELAEALDRWGYRPGKLWALLIALTQLIAGPMFATGLFTRPLAAIITTFLVFSMYERGRVGGYFWNTQGLEFPLLWSAAVLFFVAHGGGVYSLDHILLGHEF